MDDQKDQNPLPKRLMWFAGIWLASVLALTLVSLILRFILNGVL